MRVADESRPNGKGWEPVPMATGQAFEINNALEHFVKNPDAPEARTRIHLIIDWADDPVAAKYSELAPGGICRYGAEVECNPGAISRVVDLPDNPTPGGPQKAPSM